MLKKFSSIEEMCKDCLSRYRCGKPEYSLQGREYCCAVRKPCYDLIARMCSDCKHAIVCKHKKEALRYEQAHDAINIEDGIFSVKVNCKHHCDGKTGVTFR